MGIEHMTTRNVYYHSVVVTPKSFAVVGGIITSQLPMSPKETNSGEG